MLQYEYAREALKKGLQHAARLGVNPYKFGLQAATDSHTGLATAEEDNFFGKHSLTEPNPKRMTTDVGHFDKNRWPGWYQVASGYTGVWATENTREAIFDAMMRKETYATTGSRITVRFFGGWEYNNEDTLVRQPANVGYEKGVPMGGDLSKAPAGKAPTFLVAARKDPYSGNLDRIQVIKGWKDPEFNPAESAFYYVRVIEIPTPRWTAYEAKYFKVEAPKESPMTTQERAYTSPIWYTP